MSPPSKADLWSTGRDETVEVNQRALIDKILARYSGEHTIFRELLQNADDAGAEHVQVKFYTQSGLDALDRGEGPSRLPDAKKDLIHRCTITNDGIPFRPEDWQRLKKIAEGNPDEEKIGAFGVGFFSLFSVADDPFVESGDKWMGFYWKDGKDQLFARSGQLPPTASSSAIPSMTGHPWTSFTLNMREPSVLEGPLDLARFFVTSLTFMRTMKKIDMMVDGIKVFEVEKSVKGKQKVHKTGMKTSSANGMMSVTGVDATGMIMTARVMKWLSATGFIPPPLPAQVAIMAKPAKAFTSLFSTSFFNRASPSPTPPPPPPPPPPLDDPTEVTGVSREIQIYQADIKVSVSPTFARELERATKKAPPARMPASLVFSREEEDVHTLEGDSTAGKSQSIKDAGGVFAGLCPPLDGEKSAKIFIGQATGQTTGIGGHLSARFIPTVERESIDLVDRHVSHWNRELLWIGGYLSRLIYELEMQSLQTQWNQISASDQTVRTRILARGLQILRFFSFQPTTPSFVVGQEMESAFFMCVNDNKTFPLVSTAGILPVSQVRMPSEDLLAVVPDLPVITAATMEEAPRPVARLRERNLLRDVAFDDVVSQLGKRPLSEKEMMACLNWWQTIANMDGLPTTARTRLLDAAILLQDHGKVVPLSLIQTFVKPQTSSIPTDMPLPHHTLPYTITKDLKGGTIYQSFGWTELSLLQYITFLINPPMSDSPQADADTDIRVSPAFAERVLSLLGRAWQSVSANQQTAIALELKEVPCIPTKAGFMKPREAYFEKNLLFEDLPTITLPKNTAIKGGMEKMLLAIGVRKTVDLQLVFSRLVGGGSWTCQDLMKYLVSVKDTLATEEINRLKQTAAFPLEIEDPADGAKPSVVRQKPHQLYEPTDTIRSLGLPVLDWGEGKWRSNSDEARMLFSLGLRRVPPIDVLLGIAAGRSPMNERALQYLLSNVSNHYLNFDPNAFASVSFLPAMSASGQLLLAKPGEVFTNPACSILGFSVTRPAISSAENAAKLKIPTDPPMEQLVLALLGKPAMTVEKGQEIFEYMATRIGNSMASSIERLQKAPFIPVKSGDNTVRLLRPSDVYFSSKNDSDNLYRTAFTFIDFGERANNFLRYCGVRSEPSVKDIAKLLMRDPQRMLDQAGSAERYLDQLRLLAANWANFDGTTRLAMKQASFLLASQRVPVKKTSKKLAIFSAIASGEEDYEREWVLCKASDVAVIDDITMLQYFGQHIHAAPEEYILENFYEHLGARSLTSLVRTEHISQGAVAHSSEQAKALRQHVLERLTIFLAEARRKQSEYTVEMLGKEGNFVVTEVRDLRARYTFRDGKKEYAHLEVLYATAARVAKGKAIILTVSLTAQPDDYDIASALCGLLLKTPKADDALLLYSILSTPLMALKKRGFNVDRILNQQREERLRFQAEAVRDRENLTRNGPDTKGGGGQEKAGSTRAITMPPASDDRSIRSGSTSSTAIDEENQPIGKRKSLLDRFKMPNRDSNSPSSTLSQKAQSALEGLQGSLPQNGGGSNNSGGGLAGGPRGGNTTKRPTDLNNIRDTVQKAVDASRPEASTQIMDSRQAVKDVSESQDDYCDSSAGANLLLAHPGRSGIRIWGPGDTPDMPTFLQNKVEICERFAIEILLPIGQAYKLSPSVLNIFWDHEGPLIAFNKGGSIFCNARYFSAWHDVACQNGQRAEAFISWYFSIAHELAHNLESAHNSAHEFYFSSIAEEYLTRFIPLLQAGH